jgi:hypothetical protein
MTLTTIFNSGRFETRRCEACPVTQRRGRFITIFHSKTPMTAISVFLIGLSPGY